MNPIGKRVPRRVRHVILAAVIAGLSAVAVAEQVVVKTDVDVRADKNPLADAVESVPTETKLEVLGREGGWVKVRTPGGKEGYVAQDDLPANTNLAGAQGNAVASDVDASAAGRGLQEDTEKYAAAKNLNKAGVNQMLAWNKAVSSNDLKAFAAAGHVGAAKYRK
jgi:hypothetical protein